MPLSSPNAAYQPVRAPRGNAISCKGWQQETVLRLLLNSLDPAVAERPEELNICGAFGKTAADWESFNAIAESLRNIRPDHYLLVSAGKPERSVFGSINAPRVLSVDHSVPALGNWLYAGTQTALPVLYEIYAAAARQHFSGALAGKLVLGAGLGGLGGAQPLAATLNGAAFLGIDADPERIKRRVKTGYCDVMVNHLDEALRILKNAVRKKEAASVALIGNCAEVIPALAQRGVVPDLMTDLTPRDNKDNYIPLGFDAAAQERHSQGDEFDKRRAESIDRQTQGIFALQKLGARFLAPDDCLQPLVNSGSVLTMWMALSGENADIAAIDRHAVQTFPENERLQQWLPVAKSHVRWQGLPARVIWLSLTESVELALAVNELVAKRELSTPALFGWHFGVPGTNVIAPGFPGWLLKIKAAWVYFHAGGASGTNQLAAAAVVADGTDETKQALKMYSKGLQHSANSQSAPSSFLI